VSHGTSFWRLANGHDQWPSSKLQYEGLLVAEPTMDVCMPRRKSGAGKPPTLKIDYGALPVVRVVHAGGTKGILKLLIASDRDADVSTHT